MEDGTTKLQEQQETQEQDTKETQKQETQKTYTQAELDAREASTRKAAEDRAKKALMKELGITSTDEIKALIKAKETATAEAEAKEDLGKKYGKATETIAAKERELAEITSKAIKLEQSLLVRDMGYTGEDAEMITLYLASKVTDEKDFQTVAKEFAENPPERFAKDVKSQKANMPGGSMGAGQVDNVVSTKAEFNNLTHQEKSEFRRNHPQLYARWFPTF